MFKQPNWKEDLKQRQQAKQPKSEIYYDDEEVLEGTDIEGRHFHVWRLKSGLYQISYEEVKSE
jgi:hypothetical protein